jgi:CheY-like chemotaxis protein
VSDSRPLAILIAETDPHVRMLTADMLAEVGFQPIEVCTAAEALAVLQGPATVRMLITGRSVVGDGVALAHLVHHRWPDIGIIVTSGAGKDLQRELPSGTRLLSKPYVLRTSSTRWKPASHRCGRSPQPLPSCRAEYRLIGEWSWAAAWEPLPLPRPSRTRRDLCLHDG